MPGRSRERVRPPAVGGPRDGPREVGDQRRPVEPSHPLEADEAVVRQRQDAPGHREVGDGGVDRVQHVGRHGGERAAAMRGLRPANADEQGTVAERHVAGLGPQRERGQVAGAPGRSASRSPRTRPRPRPSRPPAQRRWGPCRPGSSGRRRSCRDRSARPSRRDGWPPRPHPGRRRFPARRCPRRSTARRGRPPGRPGRRSRTPRSRPTGRGRRARGPRAGRPRRSWPATFPLPGSIRDTESSPLLATHTPPGPTTIAAGLPGTSMVCTTEFRAGLIAGYRRAAAVGDPDRAGADRDAGRIGADRHRVLDARVLRVDLDDGSPVRQRHPYVATVDVDGAGPRRRARPTR